MSKKTVTIVGVGALGSHVSLFLRSEDIILRVIDFDLVEMKNVASQFHPKLHVRRLKTDSLKQTLQFLFGLKIETNSNKLVADNVKQLLGGSALIVDCLDNGPSRRLIQTFARETKTPCVHGGLAADGTYARVIWDEDFVADDVPDGHDGATCEDGRFLPFIGVASAHLALAAQKFLTDGKKVGYSITPNGVMLI